MTGEENLIWIDLEMSGLNPEQHVILEVASIVTGGGLQVVDQGPNIVIHYDEDALRSMESWSREHHGASGLLDRVRSSEWGLQAAEQATLDFLSRHCIAGKSPLCGNSVWQDRRFLIRHMPRLEAFLHYRNIDVSSVKELVRRWYPELPRFSKMKAHLALDDILESIRELEYYKDHVFVP